MDRFSSVTTVDASAMLLNEMQKQLAGKQWISHVSLFEEYVPDKPFDAVIATYVLEHVDDPDLIIRTAHDKWLKSGGLLTVVVPHALSLHRRLAVKMGLVPSPDHLGDTDRRMGHKRCFMYTDMEKMLLDAGFKVIEMQGLFTKLLPNSLLVNCSDDQLRGMFELGLELPIEYSATIYFLAQKNE